MLRAAFDMAALSEYSLAKSRHKPLKEEKYEPVVRLLAIHNTETT
jgi:hypothetical protein